MDVDWWEVLVVRDLPAAGWGKLLLACRSLGASPEPAKGLWGPAEPAQGLVGVLAEGHP